MKKSELTPNKYPPSPVLHAESLPEVLRVHSGGPRTHARRQEVAAIDAIERNRATPWVSRVNRN